MRWLQDDAFSGEYTKIPQHMQDALVRYVEQGIKPGHFLSAVICNDLFEAVGHADATNLPILPVYVRWFYNIAPGSCWHSVGHMNDWMLARQTDWLAENEKADTARHS